MAKEFAFLFYTNDWAGGTQWMSRLQRGGYLDLLLFQVNNTSFSLDQIKKVLGPDFEEIWPGIKDKFLEEDGLFFNKKMREVLAARIKFSESRRANKLGKTKDSKPKKLVKKTSKPLEKLVGKEKEREKGEETESGNEVSIWPTFENFWDEYDLKKGKREAEANWSKLTQVEKENAVKYIPAYKLSTPDKKYRKHPERYISKRVWEDEVVIGSPTPAEGKTDKIKELLGRITKQKHEPAN